MKIEILVEGEGLHDVEAVSVPTGCTASEIVAAVALRGGFPADEAMLFLEDVDDPLDLDAAVPEANVHRIHHVHRARQIDVAVFFQGDQKHSAFAPSARVGRVLDWAVGPLGFNLDPAIAPEMELALHQTTIALPKSAHIGRYVHHPEASLAFDLIRGVVPNGHPSTTEQAIESDLSGARFRAGVNRGQWRQVSYAFPVLIVSVSAIEPTGVPSEYSFRFELSGYPSRAPEVRIWDCSGDGPLPVHKRPTGAARLVQAFKAWGPDTVYRAWERHSGAHNDWARKYPDQAWHAGRDLVFILEDLHGLLTSNAGACRTRPAA